MRGGEWVQSNLVPKLGREIDRQTDIQADTLTYIPIETYRQTDRLVRLETHLVSNVRDLQD